jgi:hypothetical protein
MPSARGMPTQAATRSSGQTRPIDPMRPSLVRLAPSEFVASDSCGENMRCDPGCAKVGIAFADIVVRRFFALFDLNAEFAAVTAGTLSPTLADNWRGSGRLAPRKFRSSTITTKLSQTISPRFRYTARPRCRFYVGRNLEESNSLIDLTSCREWLRGCGLRRLERALVPSARSYHFFCRNLSG